MVQKSESDLQAQFEKHASRVAENFSLDLQDVRAAYRGKEDSLSVVFNSMEDTRRARNRSIGWSVVWALVFPPLVILTGYNAYCRHEKLSAIHDQVSHQLDTSKRLTDQRPVAPKPE